MSEADFRRRDPRFQGENYDRNLHLVEEVKARRQKKERDRGTGGAGVGAAEGQRHRSHPGTKRRKYLEENAASASVTLTPQEMQQLDAIGG